MRPAPSFLLSLLFFSAIVCTQVVALWHGQGGAQQQVLSYPVALSDVDWMAEVEDELEIESPELTAMRTPRGSPMAVTLEDRTEAFWPPEPLAVVEFHLWQPPAAHVVEPHNPWPRSLLRPPQTGLRSTQA